METCVDCLSVKPTRHAGSGGPRVLAHSRLATRMPDSTNCCVSSTCTRLQHASPALTAKHKPQSVGIAIASKGMEPEPPTLLQRYWRGPRAKPVTLVAPEALLATQTNYSSRCCHCIPTRAAAAACANPMQRSPLTLTLGFSVRIAPVSPAFSFSFSLLSSCSRFTRP